MKNKHKYYIEIWSPKMDGYVLQSKLFDTKIDAIRWYFNDIDYLNNDFNASVMVLTYIDDEGNYEIEMDTKNLYWNEWEKYIKNIEGDKKDE